MKGKGCFCFGIPNVKEQKVEDVKSIMKKIMKGYVKSVKCEETIVGYEDLPVYREEGSKIIFDDRHIRLYFLK
jgi:hypothetical protein